MNVKEQTRNIIDENVRMSFIDAATTAQAQVEDGRVFGGHLGVVQGYLVYIFLVTDASGENVYKVIVDAGNEVLYTSHGHEFGSMIYQRLYELHLAHAPSCLPSYPYCLARGDLDMASTSASPGRQPAQI